MTLRTDVSVLYVDPRGPYPKLVADWWDAARDATQYAGPNPVVAHPPCGPWSALSHLCKQKQDKELFAHALECVRNYGGVLEHPAHSKAWKAFNLPHPRSWKGDDWGHSMEVEQCDWGHVARKRTWLYVVGVAWEVIRIPSRKISPTHWCSGGGAGRGKPPAGIKICSAQQRRRTPIAFARYLIDLAASTRVR